MKKLLYLECSSGISGDMTVAALLDLGVDQEVLVSALDSLQIDGYHVEIGRRKKQGLDACSFDVILTEHSERHNENHLHHRHMEDITRIIDSADLSEYVKSLSKKIFQVVAEAEAKAHGLPVDQVHFHEVGAVDSIVDIIAVALCLEALSIDEVIVSPLTEGSGQVRCQHGILPVPVPAVLNIVASHGLILRQSDVQGEMVTPTGAAIAAAIQSNCVLPHEYRVLKVGVGAGKKDFPQANILRAMLIQAKEEEVEPEIWVLESNMDDAPGEMLGYCMEQLFEHGAKDVCCQSIFMKKNRPAWILQVMCMEQDISTMEQIIFCHTTTIGIRRYPVIRTILERKKVMVTTPYGDAEVKQCEFEGKLRYYPEYESVKKICDASGAGFWVVYHMIIEFASK